MTKNAEIDKYGYSGLILDLIEDQVLFPGGGFGQNAFVFGVDMSFSAHIDNKKKTC